ncbi:hypothetical protein F5Y15DRAFT_82016 [Xylariaceae sp. FL0016]|nr:hypothetical protein F5Y15DRAFT_82016 [Xylariaceae sp. FL0016]
MMKSLKMSKVLSSIKRKNTSGPTIAVDSRGDGPEATAGRNVKAFCESGGPNNTGDEVLFLPPIVDAAESSPAAAAECARLIRKYLKRDYWTRPSYQYNAIMLIRILADNPGQTFTRNLDQKFTETVKELLTKVRDPSVHQMMMETLESFETTKGYDEGLGLLIEMWKKEKEKTPQRPRGQNPNPPLPPRIMNVPPVGNTNSQNYFARTHHSRRLPSPVELASRLEEAKTSAKLLQDTVTNTPPGEILANDLIKEFADRCQSASRSIGNYMQAEDPAPDNDTMESLIDTNEQLQQALSLHQRAVLNARKHVENLGQDSHDGVSPMDESDRNGLGISLGRASPSSSSMDQPPIPPSKANGKGKGKGKELEPYEPAVAGPSRSHTPATVDDPFRDPDESAAGGSSGNRYHDQEPRLAYEPFHPGFDTTPSYLGRQESALGKEAMHGAVPATRERDDDFKAYEGRRRNGSHADSESDLYDATPQKSKDPVYRY